MIFHQRPRYLLLSVITLAATACTSPENSPSAGPLSSANQPPRLSGTPPQTAMQDMQYSFTPTGSDPDNDPLTYAIINLPSWASFDNASGALTGMPLMQHIGTYPDITISVSDGMNSTELPAFNIEVVPNATGSANQRPRLSGTPAPTAMQDTRYSFTPVGSDPDNDPLTYAITNMPSWASFDNASGALTGMPLIQHIGMYPDITISVSDGMDGAELPAFNIEVVPPGAGSLVLSWTPPTQSVDGTPLTDLASYRIRWGYQAGVHPNLQDVNNPGVSSFVIDGLTSGRYFFVISAVDTSNNESQASNEASGTVP